eukprot:Nk52_evm8s322 gene=Nk52_evmTU8s322
MKLESNPRPSSLSPFSSSSSFRTTKAAGKKKKQQNPSTPITAKTPHYAHSLQLNDPNTHKSKRRFLHTSARIRRHYGVPPCQYDPAIDPEGAHEWYEERIADVQSDNASGSRVDTSLLGPAMARCRKYVYAVAERDFTPALKEKRMTTNREGVKKERENDQDEEEDEEEEDELYGKCNYGPDYANMAFNDSFFEIRKEANDTSKLKFSAAVNVFVQEKYFAGIAAVTGNHLFILRREGTVEKDCEDTNDKVKSSKAKAKASGAKEIYSSASRMSRGSIPNNKMVTRPSIPESASALETSRSSLSSVIRESGRQVGSVRFENVQEEEKTKKGVSRRPSKGLRRNSCKTKRGSLSFSSTNLSSSNIAVSSLFTSSSSFASNFRRDSSHSSAVEAGQQLIQQEANNRLEKKVLSTDTLQKSMEVSKLLEKCDLESHELYDMINQTTDDRLNGGDEDDSDAEGMDEFESNYKRGKEKENAKKKKKKKTEGEMDKSKEEKTGCEEEEDQAEEEKEQVKKEEEEEEEEEDEEDEEIKYELYRQEKHELLTGIRVGEKYDKGCTMVMYDLSSLRSTKMGSNLRVKTVGDGEGEEAGMGKKKKNKKKMTTKKSEGGMKGNGAGLKSKKKGNSGCSRENHDRNARLIAALLAGHNKKAIKEGISEHLRKVVPVYFL